MVNNCQKEYVPRLTADSLSSFPIPANTFFRMRRHMIATVQIELKEEEKKKRKRKRKRRNKKIFDDTFDSMKLPINWP